MKAHLLGECHKVADVAATTSLAVIRVARHLMRAARKLQAVRRYNEQTVCGHANMHAVKEQVAHGNERSF